MNNSENSVQEKCMSLFCHFWIGCRIVVWLGQRKEEEVTRGVWKYVFCCMLSVSNSLKGKDTQLKNKPKKQKPQNKPWAKGLPLVRSNRLTPLLSWLLCKWWQGSLGEVWDQLFPRSCSPQSHRVHGSCIGHRRLGQSFSLELRFRRAWAAPGVAAGTCSGSCLWLSFLLTPCREAASPFLFTCPLHSEVCGQNETLLALATATRRFCVGSLEVYFLCLCAARHLLSRSERCRARARFHDASCSCVTSTAVSCCQKLWSF